MKHQCRRDRWIHGQGWGCDDCDPAVVKARAEQAERMRQQVEANDRAAKRIYQDALRYAKRQHPDWPLSQRQAYAQREVRAAFGQEEE